MLSLACEALLRASLERPRTVLAVAVAAVLVSAPGLSRLRLVTEPRTLLAAGSSAVRADDAARATFQVRDPLIVILRTHGSGGIFQPKALRALAEVSAAIAALDDVGRDGVMSLGTEHSATRTPGTVSFPPFLQPPPESAATIAALRSELTAMGVFTGTLVSLDGQPAAPGGAWQPSAAALLVMPREGADPSHLYAEIRRLTARWETGDLRFSLVGVPVAAHLLGRSVLADLLLLVPLSLALMGAIFYLRYRSWWTVLLPLSSVGAAQIVAFGWMGYTGAPVYLPATALPVILAGIGVTDEIHLLDHLAKRLVAAGPQGDLRRILEQAMEELWRPIVGAAVTTFLGFLSFAFAPIVAVRSFGLFGALGILAGTLWSLTAGPALLALVMPRLTSLRRVGGPGTGWALWPGRLSGWALRRRGWTLAAVAVAALAAALGASRLAIQDGWQENFSPRSEFFQASTAADRLFHGSQLLRITFDTRPGALAGTLAPPPGSETFELPEELDLTLSRPRRDAQSLLDQPVMIRALRVHEGQADRPERDSDLTTEWPLSFRVSEVLERNGRTVLRLSRVTDYGLRPAVTRTGDRWRLALRSERLLDNEILTELDRFERWIETRLGADGGVLGAAEQLAVTRQMFHGRRVEERRVGDSPRDNRDLLNLFRAVRGPARLAETFEPEREQALITVFLREANFQRTARLLADLRRYETERLQPLGIRLSLAGGVPLSQAMIQAIAQSQTVSLLLSLLGIFLVAAWWSASWRLGLLNTLPAALAALFNFGLMGWLGVPLGVATSIFAGVTIGVGVDNAIHLSERFQRLSPLSPRPSDAMGRACAEAGPPLALSTLTLGLGFGLVMVSRIPATSHLGLLMVCGMVSCFVLTLVLLPALIVFLERPETAPSLPLLREEV
jgi:predicted RND superfamily exporter protein